MAAATGMSQSAISRIWRAFALAPHRSQTFKLSTDPLFIDKVRDVVGLYLDPPEKALVLCVDEKSQIQALDRSQPVLPMMPGVPERRSHDYIRAGTTTLFAALEVATGKVIGSLHRRHGAAEFKKFLAKVDKEVPADLQIHLILDNYATHKTPEIKKWLLAHPRFHLHFTPTSASWLNLVERWFAELTQKKLKRGVHRSVQALERDIRSWLANWNEHCTPRHTHHAPAHHDVSRRRGDWPATPRWPAPLTGGHKCGSADGGCRGATLAPYRPSVPFAEPCGSWRDRALMKIENPKVRATMLEGPETPFEPSGNAWRVSPGQHARHRG